MPDLPSLIRDALARGETLQSLQAKSGDVVKYQRWGQLSRGQRLTEFPVPATLAAIAVALNITETTAVVATARALGMDVNRRGSLFAQRLPRSADDLPIATQQAIIQLIHAIPTAADSSTELAAAAMEDRRPGDPPRPNPGQSEEPET